MCLNNKIKYICLFYMFIIKNDEDLNVLLLKKHYEVIRTKNQIEELICLREIKKNLESITNYFLVDIVRIYYFEKYDVLIKKSYFDL